MANNYGQKAEEKLAISLKSTNKIIFITSGGLFALFFFPSRFCAINIWANF